jgi:hypothetical protein
LKPRNGRLPDVHSFRGLEESDEAVGGQKAELLDADVLKGVHCAGYEGRSSEIHEAVVPVHPVEKAYDGLQVDAGVLTESR